MKKSALVYSSSEEYKNKTLIDSDGLNRKKILELTNSFIFGVLVADLDDYPVTDY